MRVLPEAVGDATTRFFPSSSPFFTASTWGGLSSVMPSAFSSAVIFSGMPSFSKLTDAEGVTRSGMVVFCQKRINMTARSTSLQGTHCRSYLVGIIPHIVAILFDDSCKLSGVLRVQFAERMSRIYKFWDWRITVEVPITVFHTLFYQWNELLPVLHDE